MNYILLASIAGNFAKRLKTILTNQQIQLEAIFITTAANPYQEKQWMKDDISLFKEQGFKIKTVDLEELTKTEIISLLNKTKVCIVGGGNPVYLLEVLKEKDLIPMLRKRISDGMFYIGSSAGAVIASKNIELETIFEERPKIVPLKSYEALALVDFQVLPHWGKTSLQKKYMELLKIAYNKQNTIVSLKDNQAVEIIDKNLQIIEK